MPIRMRILDSKVGYGQLGVSGNLGYEGKQVIIDNMFCSSAISAHAPSRVLLEIADNVTVHLRLVVNDDVRNGTPMTKLPVFHGVAEDNCGNILADFGNVTIDSNSPWLKISMKKNSNLLLRVETGRLDFCHSVWQFGHPIEFGHTVHIRTNYGCLGDQICLIAAARHYARRYPEQTVMVSSLPQVISAYNDNLLHSGNCGEQIICNPCRRHRKKNESPDLNYVGTYAAELGLQFQLPLSPELPRLGAPQGLIPYTYITLQPYSKTAKNPQNRREFINALVDTCRQLCPDWPIVAVGSTDTPKDWANVNYSYLGDCMKLLQAIQYSAMLLTPRSVSAHVGAAYCVPTFVWIPEDGENWHLDYPDWPHNRHSFELEEDPVCAISHFIQDVKQGNLGSVPALKRAVKVMRINEDILFSLGQNSSCLPGLIDSRGKSQPELVREAIRKNCGKELEEYPKYLNHGKAMEYILEEARAVCQGVGLDIGAGKYPLPGAIAIDNTPDQNAYKLDMIHDSSMDYVFSSHCLEHLEHPQEALQVWWDKLKPGGRLFLYLPHPDMKKWQVGSQWGGEHKWSPNPMVIRSMLEKTGFKALVCTEVPDAYWSFRCIAVKQENINPYDTTERKSKDNIHLINSKEGISGSLTPISGIFTMAWGKEFVNMADAMARSVRMFHPDIPLFAYLPVGERHTPKNFDEIRYFQCDDYLPGSKEMWTHLSQSARQMACRYKIAVSLKTHVIYVDCDCLMLNPLTPEHLAKVDFSLGYLAYQDWEQRQWQRILLDCLKDEPRFPYLSDGVFFTGKKYSTFVDIVDASIAKYSHFLHPHLHALPIVNIVSHTVAKEMAAPLPQEFVQCSVERRARNAVFFHATPNRKEFWRKARSLKLSL